MIYTVTSEGQRLAVHTSEQAAADAVESYGRMGWPALDVTATVVVD